MADIDIRFDDPIAELASSSRAEGQPMAFFEAIDQMAARETGRAFCTLLMVHPDGEGERVFSSDPAIFPLGNRKPLSGREWSKRVLGDGETFLARTFAEIRESISDLEGIERLGCSTLVNVPIVHDGLVVGTLNLGAEEDRFDASSIERVKALASLLGPSLAWLKLRDAAQARPDLTHRDRTET